MITIGAIWKFLFIGVLFIQIIALIIYKQFLENDKSIVPSTTLLLIFLQLLLAPVELILIITFCLDMFFNKKR